MTSNPNVGSALFGNRVADQTRALSVAGRAIIAILLLAPKTTAQIQPPSILGDWNVGYQKMELSEDDGARRPMDLSLWFPTEADTSLADPARYAHGTGRYAVDTDAIANGGPYPLIVYSYGTVGGPTDNSYLAESLASHGFIVAAPSHTSSEYDRPLDIQSLIDVFYEATTQPDHMLYDRVQTGGVGVAGHSFGGYSSIAASIGTNDGRVGPDPRIGAIFSLAGGSCCTSEPISIGEVKVPTLMFAGELDDPARDDRARREIALLETDDRFVAIVEETNHWDLGVSRCQQSPSTQACSNDEAMRVGATLGVSFFDRYLRDSDRFSDVLSQSYAVQHDPPFEFFSGATADTDRDGRTTFADFLKLSDSFGLTGREARRSRADFNRDEVVDFQDFLYLSLNYTGGEPVQAASVPEPSGRAMCSLWAFVLTVCRRRRLSVLAGASNANDNSLSSGWCGARMPSRSFPSEDHTWGSKMRKLAHENYATVVVVAVVSVVLAHESEAQIILGERRSIPGARTGYGPEISQDGLRLVYNSHPVDSDQLDLYSLTRPSLDEAWSDSATGVSISSSEAIEATPALSPDGSELYFSDGWRLRVQSGSRESFGAADIFASSWDELSSSWSEPMNVGEQINSPQNEWAPSFSNDGLELYFSSDRGGGYGQADIWYAQRQSIQDAWAEPQNLGAVVNSSFAEEGPAVSSDGRMLFFTLWKGVGDADLWVSTRDRVEDAWGPPVDLGSRVNSAALNEQPSISADGSTLYYSSWNNSTWSISQMDLLPMTSVPLAGNLEYQQNFDTALSPDGGQVEALPMGWTVSDNGVIFKDSITARFPLGRSIRAQFVNAFNAGHPQDSDRALAIGVKEDAPSPVLQFLTQVEDDNATSLQLSFDLESWDAADNVATPGEAAFDVSVDIDTGEGFSQLVDLGRVTTGANLRAPDGTHLDGNDGANRVQFDSGLLETDIPIGAQLRFRWTAATDVPTVNWVYGLDNVVISLHGTSATFDCNGDGILNVLDANCATSESLKETLSAANLVQGDADGDGQVQFSDFLILSEHFGTPGQYTDGDFDKDGEVQFGDFLILSQNFGLSTGATSAVPEPSGVLLTILGVAGMVGIRRVQPIPRLA